MEERRSKRSEEREMALQFLMEAVADRSEVHAVALVDESGRIVAGTGMPRDLVALAKMAGPVTRGEPCGELEARSDDLLACKIPGEALYLAALGSRVRRMPDAARSVARILAS